LSHERSDIAGAESFYSLEGNMCGTATRGAVALPGSKAISRAKGSHRKLGGLASGRQMLCERDGPHREGEEPKPMMHGHEKSDPAIVAEKPANKAERSAAELVERRAGTKGNASQPSTCRTQCRISVSQGVGSHPAAYCRHYPRWEPYAGKPHVRICAGGARQLASLPRSPLFAAARSDAIGTADLEPCLLSRRLSEAKRPTCTQIENCRV
jgi:hypothetical protein